MITKDNIIVALDVNSQKAAEEIIEKTHEYVGYYKIGLGFLTMDGIAFAASMVKKGHKIFLDLKLFDIGHTITQSVQRLSDYGFHILTVHGDPYVISAAIKGRALSGCKEMDIYGVTILTSLDQNDIHTACYHDPIDKLIIKRAQNAASAGADGVIASGQECAQIKSFCLGLKVITPGVRINLQKTGDQKRVVTPAQALKNGANHIVMGREIIHAENPKEVLKSLLD